MMENLRLESALRYQVVKHELVDNQNWQNLLQNQENLVMLDKVFSLTVHENGLFALKTRQKFTVTGGKTVLREIPFFVFGGDVSFMEELVTEPPKGWWKTPEVQTYQSLVGAEMQGFLRVSSISDETLAERAEKVKDACIVHEGSNSGSFDLQSLLSFLDVCANQGLSWAEGTTYRDCTFIGVCALRRIYADVTSCAFGDCIVTDCVVTGQLGDYQSIVKSSVVVDSNLNCCTIQYSELHEVMANRSSIQRSWVSHTQLQNSILIASVLTYLDLNMSKLRFCWNLYVKDNTQPVLNSLDIHSAFLGLGSELPTLRVTGLGTRALISGGAAVYVQSDLLYAAGIEAEDLTAVPEDFCYTPKELLNHMEKLKVVVKAGCFTGSVSEFEASAKRRVARTAEVARRKKEDDAYIAVVETLASVAQGRLQNCLEIFRGKTTIAGRLKAAAKNFVK